MAQKISTWSGLFTMLGKSGLVQQFRSAQTLTKRINPSAYYAAQDEGYGTAEFGAAIAKIIEDKKAGKKSNPSHAAGGFLEEALERQREAGSFRSVEEASSQASVSPEEDLIGADPGDDPAVIVKMNAELRAELAQRSGDSE
jgi:hypothetical protein